MSTTRAASYARRRPPGQNVYDGAGRPHTVNYAGSTRPSVFIGYVSQLSAPGLTNPNSRISRTSTTRRPRRLHHRCDGAVTAFTYDAVGTRVKRPATSAYTTAGDQSLATDAVWATMLADSGNRVTRTVYGVRSHRLHGDIRLYREIARRPAGPKDISYAGVSMSATSPETSALVAMPCPRRHQLCL